MKNPQRLSNTSALSRSEASFETFLPFLDAPPRHPVSWVGLTLAMGTMGIIVGQGNGAIAATRQPIDSLVNIPSVTTQSSRPSPEGIATPVWKHEVKKGESLWALAENYQIKPDTLARFNQLPSHAELSVGQTLKIPSLQPEIPQSLPKATNALTPKPLGLVTAPNLKSSETTAVETVETAADYLQETRERLSEQLTNAAERPGEIPAQVSDVSEPIKKPSSPQLTSLIPSESQAIPIPVIDVDGQEILPTSEATTPIPISVPTPETHQASIQPTPVDDSPTRLPEPKRFDKPLPPDETPQLEEAPREQAYYPSSGSTSTVLPNPLPITVPSPTVTTPVQRNTYQVRGGDTLNEIARRHGLSVTALIQANDISNPNLIKANQTLIIPKPLDEQTAKRSAKLANLSFPKRQPSSYPVNLAAAPSSAIHTDKLKADFEQLQADYTPSEIPVLAYGGADGASTTVGVAINPEWQKDQQKQPSSATNPSYNLDRDAPQSQLIGTATGRESNDNRFQVAVGTSVSPELPALLLPEDYLPDAPMKFTGYIWPAKGVLTSGFGQRWGRMHKGIDIAAPIGTPIVAAAEGEVITSGWNSGGYGNLVKVRHPDGSITLYGHNSRLLVRSGQQVERGQLIAEMGSTGYSTGPHLHFEVHPQGQGARNPIAFLPNRNR